MYGESNDLGGGRGGGNSRSSANAKVLAQVVDGHSTSESAMATGIVAIALATPLKTIVDPKKSQ